MTEKSVQYLLDDLRRNHLATNRDESIYSRAMKAITSLHEQAIICRGSFHLGTACGHCHKCKAQAFDWLCSNSAALDEWAILQTGHHDIMGAIKKAIKGNKHEN